MDQIRRLAHSLVTYSLEVKPGEKVLIEAKGQRAVPLVREIIREVYAAGGAPLYRFDDDELMAAYLSGVDDAALEIDRTRQMAVMQAVQCYLGIRGSENALELSGVPAERMAKYTKQVMQPVHFEQRINHTRWCVMRYPSPGFAQAARMSTEKFEEFFFQCCLLDYARMSRAMEPLRERMAQADKVHIKGPGKTDLKFSIKGIGAVKCDGKLNLPDGEVFSAPVKDSVNGVLEYNTATVYDGKFFDGVRLKFKDGKIVDADCLGGSRAELNSIFDRDEGARYVGEFSLAFNPYIDEPMLDILFDEKIAGSFHFTPGNAYEITPNGNKSTVHWDLVCIQRPDRGGGEIWFDGELIRKDGTFVVEDLRPLNPEHLR